MVGLSPLVGAGALGAARSDTLEKSSFVASAASASAASPQLAVTGTRIYPINMSKLIPVSHS